MALPRTRREMLRAQYQLVGKARPCEGCGHPLEWWKTTNGKNMPFLANPDNEAVAEIHWGKQCSAGGYTVSQRERVLFDPASIEIGLKANLSDGLRALADAIDAGQLDGTLLSAKAHGFCRRNDHRAHVIVAVDVSAPIELYFEGRYLSLPAPELDLPAASAYAAKGLTKC